MEIGNLLNKIEEGSSRVLTMFAPVWNSGPGLINSLQTCIVRVNDLFPCCWRPNMWVLAHRRPHDEISPPIPIIVIVIVELSTQSMSKLMSEDTCTLCPVIQIFYWHDCHTPVSTGSLAQTLFFCQSLQIITGQGWDKKRSGKKLKLMWVGVEINQGHKITFFCTWYYAWGFWATIMFGVVWGRNYDPHHHILNILLIIVLSA